METLPPWVIVFMPLVVLVVTFLANRVPALAQFGPRNIGAVVSFVIAAIAVATEPPVLAGADVMELAAAVVALVLYWWKTAQVVYDLFTGQLATPDGHAES